VRRQRGDARKRADAALLRSQESSVSSLHPKYMLGDGPGTKTIRQEIEAYREQVLQVYPDMNFDGKAGKDGRECWCVVM